MHTFPCVFHEKPISDVQGAVNYLSQNMKLQKFMKSRWLGGISCYLYLYKETSAEGRPSASNFVAQNKFKYTLFWWFLIRIFLWIIRGTCRDLNCWETEQMYNFWGLVLRVSFHKVAGSIIYLYLRYVYQIPHLAKVL